MGKDSKSVSVRAPELRLIGAEDVQKDGDEPAGMSTWFNV